MISSYCGVVRGRKEPNLAAKKLRGLLHVSSIHPHLCVHLFHTKIPMNIYRERHTRISSVCTDAMLSKSYGTIMEIYIQSRLNQTLHIRRKLQQNNREISRTVCMRVGNQATTTRPVILRNKKCCLANGLTDPSKVASQDGAGSPPPRQAMNRSSIVGVGAQPAF